MSTIYQRYNGGVLKRKDQGRTPGLRRCPQVRGTVMRARIVTPRKPNSAKRPVAKVILCSRKRVTAHIPGVGHNIRRYSKVFVRGGGSRDLPGVRYSLIRGVLDFMGLVNKKRRRSIYGAPQPDYMKRMRRKEIKKLELPKDTRDFSGENFLEDLAKPINISQKILFELNVFKKNFFLPLFFKKKYIKQLDCVESKDLSYTVALKYVEKMPKVKLTIEFKYYLFRAYYLFDFYIRSFFKVNEINYIA